MTVPLRENSHASASDRIEQLTSPSYFSPADHFLGIAGRVAASPSGALVSLPAGGEVLILPDQGVYFADVPDMEEFCRAPAMNFKVSHPKKDERERLAASDTGVTGYIPELLWEAAFHASQGRLVGSRASEGEEEVHVYDVIGFRRWPNLTRLSQTPNTMRICALLTRQPSSILLVARKLGIDPREVYQVYSAACSYGIVKVVSSNLAKHDSDEGASAGMDEGDSVSVVAQSHGLMRALLAKIAGL